MGEAVWLTNGANVLSPLLPEGELPEETEKGFYRFLLQGILTPHDELLALHAGVALRPLQQSDPMVHLLRSLRVAVKNTVGRDDHKGVGPIWAGGGGEGSKSLFWKHECCLGTKQGEPLVPLSVGVTASSLFTLYLHTDLE